MDIGGRISRVKQHFTDSIRTGEQSLALLAAVIARAARRSAQALDQGGKVVSCGNCLCNLINQHIASQEK